MHTPTKMELTKRVMYLLPPDLREVVLDTISRASSSELDQLALTPQPALTAPMGVICAAPFADEESAFHALRGASACWHATIGAQSDWSVDRLVSAYTFATGLEAGNLETALKNDARMSASADSSMLLNLLLAVPTAGALGRVLKSSRLGWAATLGGMLVQQIAERAGTTSGPALVRMMALGEHMQDQESTAAITAWQIGLQPHQGKSPAEWTAALQKIAAEAPTVLFGLGTLWQSGVVPKMLGAGSAAAGAVRGLLPKGDPDLSDTGPSEAGDPDVEIGRLASMIAAATPETGSLGRLIKRLKPAVLPMLASAVPGGSLIAGALGATANSGTPRRRSRALPKAEHVDRLLATAHSGALAGHDGAIDPGRLAEMLRAFEDERAEEERTDSDE